MEVDESVHVPDFEENSLGTINNNISGSIRRSDIVIQKKFNVYPRLEHPPPSKYLCVRMLQNIVKCFNHLCKPRSLEGFRILLSISLLINLAAVAAEIYYFPPIPHTSFSSNEIIVIFTLVIAAINCLFVVKLLCKPTTNSSLIAFTLTIFLFCLYSAQTIIWYIQNPDTVVSWEIGFIISLLVLVFCTSLILFRYYEFVLYQYYGDEDETTDTSNPDNRNSIRSSLIDVADRMDSAEEGSTNYRVSRLESADI